MADYVDNRINAMGNTASSPDKDDYIAIDGSTNGSRRMLVSVLAKQTSIDKLDSSVFATSDYSAKVKVSGSGIYIQWDGLVTKQSTAGYNTYYSAVKQGDVVKVITYGMTKRISNAAFFTAIPDVGSTGTPIIENSCSTSDYAEESVTYEVPSDGYIAVCCYGSRSNYIGVKEIVNVVTTSAEKVASLEEKVNDSSSALYDSTVTISAGESKGKSAKLTFVESFTEEMSCVFTFPNKDVKKLQLLDGASRNIDGYTNLWVGGAETAFFSIPTNTRYLRVYPTAVSETEQTIAITITKRGGFSYISKLAEQNAADIEELSEAYADDEGAYIAADNKERFLSLSAGISQTDRDNGTSKYDELRRITVDKNLCDNAVALFYNLKKLAWEGRSLLAKDKPFAYKNIDVGSSEPYTPQSGTSDVGYTDNFEKYMGGKKFACYGIHAAEFADSYADNISTSETYAPKATAQVISLIRRRWYENKSFPIFGWVLANPYTPSGTSAAYGYIDSDHPNVVSEILNGTGTTCGFGNASGNDNSYSYENPKAWHTAMCEKIADFLNQLSFNGDPIPVILRLFQEHNRADSWWWGTNYCSADEFKEFVQLTTDTIKSKLTLHNVLFGFCVDDYNSDSYGSILTRYAGDEYVDVIGFDDYDLPVKDRDMNAVALLTSRLAERKNKIPMMFESAYKGQDGTTQEDVTNAYNNIMYNKLRDISSIKLGILQIYSTDNAVVSEMRATAYAEMLKRNNILSAGDVDISVIE